MAQFSVNYSGIASVGSRLNALFKRVDGIAGKLYTTANKANGIPSLENKGYVTFIRGHGVGVGEDADAIRIQGCDLDEIGRVYSGTEKRILTKLASSVEHGDFTEDSLAITQGALETHRSYLPDDHVLRAIDESLSTQGVRGGIQRFRFWRSTKGSELVKGAAETLLGEDGLDNVVVREAIKDLNKKVMGLEDILTAATNPTNPDALAQGGKAVVGMLGLGGFADMIPRYLGIHDAVSEQASQVWAQGDKGKAICYALSATTLATFQVTGDLAWNSAKFALSTASGGIFKTGKRAAEGILGKAPWNIVKNSTSKATSLEQEGFEGYFTQFSEWCWSRLDGAYGL